MSSGDPRPETPAPPVDRIDASFDEFEEVEILGSGGNADVTKVGYDGQPDVLALKQPRLQGTMDTDGMQQFVEEAEVWNKIDSHEHIVTVYDWGSEPLPWIGLEYMDGGNLSQRTGELSVPEALWVGVCVCRAVRHAHRRGIAHLDLKPENVLFKTTSKRHWDFPKVADWGLAKMLLEHSKSVEGLSPQYAAPEQFDESTYGPPDDFSDIYGVGAIIYTALTGEPPFTGAAASVMQSVLSEEPDPPSTYDTELPEGVDTVLLTALAKSKDDRYESIIDLRRDLETLLKRAVKGDSDSTSQISSTARSTQSSAAKSTDSPNSSETRQRSTAGAGVQQPREQAGGRQQPRQQAGGRQQPREQAGGRQQPRQQAGGRQQPRQQAGGRQQPRQQAGGRQQPREQAAPRNAPVQNQGEYPAPGEEQTQTTRDSIYVRVFRRISQLMGFASLFVLFVGTLFALSQGGRGVPAIGVILVAGVPTALFLGITRLSRRRPVAAALVGAVPHLLLMIAGYVGWAGTGEGVAMLIGGPSFIAFGCLTIVIFRYAFANP